MKSNSQFDDTSSNTPSASEKEVSLLEVGKYFGRLGCLGFGGPMALVANMRQELVVNRKWMAPDKFDQVFTLIKMMPGPVAFMCAVYLGHHKRSFWGALIAALGLVIPAFLIVILIAANEQIIATNPWVGAFFRGLQVASIGIIFASIYNLSSAYLKNLVFWLLALSCSVLFWFRVLPEPLLILGYALCYLLFLTLKSKSSGISKSLAVMVAPLDAEAWNNLRMLAVSCFKAGAFVFGSGLAIVPMLEDDFVGRLHWMNHFEFMNALSIGQLTPGPVVITVSYIGFKKLGWLGAITATIAIFLPAFFHMVTWFPHLVPKLSKWKWVKDFSFAAIAAVVGCLLAATSSIAISLNLNHLETALAAIVIFLVVKYKINSIYLVLGVGFVHLALYSIS